MTASNDPRMTKIVRRHTHDVRNYINSLDLEATLLEEIITDPEAIEGVQRMRSQLSQLEATVKALSLKFADPHPTLVTAADLYRLWRMQVASLEDDTHRVEWQEPVAPRELTIDPSAVVSVLRELVVDAWKRSPSAALKASVKTLETEVIAEVRETSQRHAAAEDWVLEHEQLITVNGGTLRHVKQPESNEVATTMSFPATLD